MSPAMTTPSTGELIDIISAGNTLGESVLWDSVGARKGLPEPRFAMELLA